MTTTNLGMTKPTVGADSDTWGGELNADLDLIDAFAGKLMPGAEVSIASAAVTDIGAAASTAVAITGTATITSFGTVANCIRFARFAGALTLTHNATSLILLGGANHTTAAGDTAIYRSDASGNWREVAYCSAAHNPGSHTGTGALVHANSPTLGAATTTSLAINGAVLAGSSLAVNGPSRLIGDIFTSNVTCAPAGNGQFVSLGFGSTGTFDNGSIITNNGNGFQVNCNSAGNTSTGVILDNTANSWRSLSSRNYKKDLIPIPGDPFVIIQAHEVALGRYNDDEADAPLRAFLFWEDARAHYPYATGYRPAGQRECPVSGTVEKITELKTLSYEQFVPLLISAFQKQISVNQALEARIAALEVI